MSSWLAKGRILLERAEKVDDPRWRGHVKYELYIRAAFWIVLALVRELILIRQAMR